MLYQTVPRTTTYQLSSLLHVRTLETRNHRSAQVHVPHNIDETLRDRVAANNTAEDVDKDRGHLWIAGDEFKCRFDCSRRRATANVQEVGRVATVELDNVHRRHSQAGTIDCIP